MEEKIMVSTKRFLPPVYEGLNPCRPDTWPAFLTLEEVACVLRLSLGTVRQLVQQKLRAQRWGKQYRVKKSELEMFQVRR